MKLTIDNTADARNLTLSEVQVEETRHVAPGVMLDIDAEGRGAGVEFVSISKGVGRDDLPRLLFETLGSAASPWFGQALAHKIIHFV